METIGVALGGGGARGLAHIHVIEIFDELGLKPSMISGTSIGALIGAAWASGMDGYEIREHFLSVFSNPTNVFLRLWTLRPNSFTDFWQRGLRMTQFNLPGILDKFLPENLPETFAELKIPFWVSAVDLRTSLEVTMNSGDLRSAIAGSAAIPTLFSPVERDEMLLLDGCLSNPLPFDYLKNYVDFSIAVDVSGSNILPDTSKRFSIRDSLVAATFISQRSLIEARLNHIRPSLLLTAPVDGIYVLDFLRARNILKETEIFRDQVKRLLEITLERKSSTFGNL